MTKKPHLIIAVVILLIIALNSLFILDQRKQALVLQFGEPMKVVQKAGLNFKTPFVQNVLYFDNRLLDLTAANKEIIASDQKRLIINAFAKYKITDPLAYFTTVRNEYGVKNKLNTILDSSLRQVIGEIPLKDLLTEQRSEIMQKIQKVVNERSKEFGIDVVDVRIMRSDLPQENSNAIYRRMQTKREREAKEIRAQGAEEAQKIIATTDKDKVVLLAEAKKKGEIMKGTGEAEATKIFAKAFGRDPEFFDFYRSMQAYKKSLKGNKTKLVISPKNDFFKKLINPNRRSAY